MIGEVLPIPPTLQGLDLAAARAAAVSGDVRRIQDSLTRPTQQLVDKVLDEALPTRAKAQFLLKHADFVKGHLMEIFERFEGPVGCADKAIWVYENLLRRFLAHPAGKELVERVAPLPGRPPVRVLQSGEAILDAFRAIEHLYAGQAFAYMEWLSRVGRALQEEVRALRLAGSLLETVH